MRSRAYLLVGVWAIADSVLREDDPARSAKQPSYDTSGIEVWALEEKVDGALRAPALTVLLCGGGLNRCSQPRAMPRPDTPHCRPRRQTARACGSGGVFSCSFSRELLGRDGNAARRLLLATNLRRRGDDRQRSASRRSRSLVFVRSTMTRLPLRSKRASASWSAA